MWHKLRLLNLALHCFHTRERIVMLIRLDSLREKKKTQPPSPFTQRLLHCLTPRGRQRCCSALTLRPQVESPECCGKQSFRVENTQIRWKTGGRGQQEDRMLWWVLREGWMLLPSYWNGVRMALAVWCASPDAGHFTGRLQELPWCAKETETSCFFLPKIVFMFPAKSPDGLPALPLWYPALSKPHLQPERDTENDSGIVQHLMSHSLWNKKQFNKWLQEISFAFWLSKLQLMVSGLSLGFGFALTFVYTSRTATLITVANNLFCYIFKFEGCSKHFVHVLSAQLVRFLFSQLILPHIEQCKMTTQQQQ